MVEDFTTIITSLGFPSSEAFIALLVITLAVIALIAVIAALRPVLSLYPILIPMPRVRARQGRLLTDKQYSEILESQNIGEIKNYLREYQNMPNISMNSLWKRHWMSQLAETYDIIARIAPDNSKDAFSFLMKKWDIRNIKSLIIAKEARLSADETMNLLVPFGELSDRLNTLVDTDNVEEILNGLEGTNYAPILEDALPQYKETGLILPLEASLDNYLLENLLRTAATPEDDNTALLHEYVGTMVDIANIKIILRAKTDGLKFEDIEPYMITKGYQVREWKLKELMESEDVPGVINGLEGTDYSPVLSDILNDYSVGDSIAPFETALDNYINEIAKEYHLKTSLE